MKASFLQVSQRVACPMPQWRHCLMWHDWWMPFIPSHRTSGKQINIFVHHLCKITPTHKVLGQNRFLKNKFSKYFILSSPWDWISNASFNPKSVHTMVQVYSGYLWFLNHLWNQNHHLLVGPYCPILLSNIMYTGPNIRINHELTWMSIWYSRKRKQ